MVDDALASAAFLLCLIYLELIFSLSSGESRWWRQSPGLWQPAPARISFPRAEQRAAAATPAFHSEWIVKCGGSHGEASTAFAFVHKGD